MIPTEQLRKEVLQIILETIKEVASVNLNKYINDFCSIAEKIVNNNLRVAIVGKLMSGKTTLINAIIGEEVCPTTYKLSSNGITTKLEYGKKKLAKIVFKNPLPINLSQGINESINAHIGQHHHDVPSKNIEISQIEEYLTLDSDSFFFLEERIINYPFERVEIQYPADILKDGIELFDTCSINECEQSEKKLLDLLHTVDSIIFILDSLCPCSEIEKEFLEKYLIPMGFKDILFVVSRYDLIPNKEKNQEVNFINNKVSEFTKHDVSYVSALLALEGRQGYDIQGEKLSEGEIVKSLEKSSFNQFEIVLREYLAEQQKKKLLGQIRKLKSLINTQLLFTEIPKILEQTKGIDDGLIKCKDHLNKISHRLDEILFDFIEG